jgi:hypothetical protein
MAADIDGKYGRHRQNAGKSKTGVTCTISFKDKSKSRVRHITLFLSMTTTLLAFALSQTPLFRQSVSADFILYPFHQGRRLAV